MFKATIGLEIHIELKTKSKMFCSCLNDPLEHHPNINICPICLGHPGTLPVINQEAVRKTIKTGLALNCRIPSFSKFDRKNYFYPDLPKGYQISQYDFPLSKEGYLNIPVFDQGKNTREFKKIRIARVHLEEDTGKLVHDKDYSLVDFNRAGVPLMELVTEPDFSSPQEAKTFAQELQLILRYLGVSEADMEKGQMRVEANISLRPDKEEGNKLGTKVEIKNLNSFRAVERALNYEIERQKKVLESGQKIIQETRGWDEKKEITVSQRKKEESHDYRYFPEPDLPPLEVRPEMVEEIRSEIPELPQEKRERFKREYGLSGKEIEVFVVNKDWGEFYEKAMSELREWLKETEFKSEVEEKEFLKLSKLCLNYFLTDLLGLLKGASIKGEDFLITPENFAEFITLIYQGKISSKIAKVLLEEMFSTGGDPSHIIKEKGLSQITDESEIEEIVKDVISENGKPVSDYKKGKESALQFLIGRVMSASQGKADPERVKKVLKEKLAELEQNL